MAEPCTVKRTESRWRFCFKQNRPAIHQSRRLSTDRPSCSRGGKSRTETEEDKRTDKRKPRKLTRSDRCYAAGQNNQSENLVDLAGIEPATSSMPWNYKKCKLLTVKGQKID
jgi:hypothetical protein